MRLLLIVCALLFSGCAAVPDGSVTDILAVHFSAMATDRPPQAISPETSLEECLDKARKANAEDEQLRGPTAQLMGAEYVCLHIHRAR